MYSALYLDTGSTVLSVFSALGDDAKKELWATLALRHARGIGLRRGRILLDAYGGAFAAVDEALRVPGAWTSRKLLPSDIAGAFAAEEWRLGAQAEWQALRRANCAFLLQNDPDFPPLLRELPDCPLLLYLAGDASLLRSRIIAVIGARDCTQEGIAVAAYIARELSKSGITVISGMAKGIDRVAHLAALQGPGKSIGVLGTGIDIPYPLCNTDLYSELTQQGLLVSEFAPGTRPAARHFPIRNRIISGLSLGVLVVEAADRSGSLITARLALEQGRDVFAVPGHTMAAVSGGCRKLIRLGAKAAFSAEDILVELAPLLQASLPQTRGEAKHAPGTQRHKAKRRIDGLDTSLLNEATDILPQGRLPWVAPRSSQAGISAEHSPGSTPPDPAPSSHAGKHTRDATPCPTQPLNLGTEEERLLAELGREPVHIDVLSQKLHLDAGRLSGMLTLLEVRGLVSRAPGMLYSLPPRW